MIIRIFHILFIASLISLFCAVHSGAAIEGRNGNNTVSENKSGTAQGAEKSQANEGSKPELKRDPFWPVGYRPSQGKSEAQAAAERKEQLDKQKAEEAKLERLWKAAQEKINVSGVSQMGNEYFAIINQDMKERDDTIAVQHENYTFVWTIVEISKDGVELQRRKAIQKKTNQ